MRRRFFPLLVIASVLLAGASALAFGAIPGIDPGTGGTPAATAPTKTTKPPPPPPPPKSPALVRAAVRQYAADVASKGGAAACRLFPDWFGPPHEKLKLPSPYHHPHPAPKDGCQWRSVSAINTQEAPAWRSSTIVRFGRVRFISGMARVRARIRSSYDAGPEIADRDLIWLKPAMGKWAVARPSLLVFRVFDPTYEPYDVLDPPAPEHDRAVRTLAPSTPCEGKVLRIADRVGPSDRPKELPASANTDLERVEMSRVGRGLCVRLQTRGRILARTFVIVYFQQSGGTEGQGLRIDPRGRVHSSARVGVTGRTLSIRIPSTRSLEIGRGRFAFFVRIGHYDHDPVGTLDGSDMAPDTKTHLYYVYPSGQLTQSIQYDPRFH